MIKEKLSKLPGRIIRHFMICLGGILGFILLAIVPSQKSIADLNSTIRKMETQVKAQKILFPVYMNLLKKGQLEDIGDLPFPKKTRLESEEIDNISDLFRKKSEKSNLELMKVVPDIESLASATGLLGVSMNLRGNFYDFRKFLIQVGEIPCVEHLEEVQIQSGEGLKEFRLKLWLAINEPSPQT